jgi:hypothetical protein
MESEGPLPSSKERILNKKTPVHMSHFISSTLILILYYISLGKCRHTDRNIFRKLVVISSSQTFFHIRFNSNCGNTTKTMWNADYESVSRSFWIGSLERELQMVQNSAIWCSCVAILWVSLVGFIAITLCVASQHAVPKLSKHIFRYRLNPEWIYPHIIIQRSSVW